MPGSQHPRALTQPGLGGSRACQIRWQQQSANWSERAEVHIWDLEEQLRATSDREAMSSFIKNKQKNIKPVYSFSGFRNEGYALDWSDTQAGEQKLYF